MPESMLLIALDPGIRRGDEIDIDQSSQSRQTKANQE